MSRNRFTKHIKEQRRISITEELKRQKTTSNLLAASLKFTGTPMKLLLDDKQIKMAKEFMELMSFHNYPMSTKLKLEAKTNRSILSPKELKNGSWHYQKRTRLLNRVKWQRLWIGHGYFLGVLTDSPVVLAQENNSTPVYLCSDLMLRCQRIEPIFKDGQSLSSGVGDLPVGEMTNYKFYIGRFYVADNETHTMLFRQEDMESMMINLAEVRLLDQSAALNSSLRLG